MFDSASDPQQVQIRDEQCIAPGLCRKPCSVCLDGLVYETTATLHVQVEKGMEHGHKITFESAADEELGKSPGNVVVMLRTLPHHTFQVSIDVI